jgi:hypothetical protein
MRSGESQNEKNEKVELEKGVKLFLQARKAVIDGLTAQMIGAVGLYCEMKGLKGDWVLSSDATTLIRNDETFSGTEDRPARSAGVRVAAQAPGLE